MTTASENGAPSADEIEWVASVVQHLLAEAGLAGASGAGAGLAAASVAGAGMETALENAADPDQAALVAAHARYPLQNALRWALDAPEELVPRLLAPEVARFVELHTAWTNPAAAQLTTEIRTQLFRDREHGGPALDYARPVAEGLVLGLSLLRPNSLDSIDDKQLTELPLHIDALYRWGQANTEIEPFERMREAQPGVFMAVGRSPVTASRATDLRSVFGWHPFGSLFTVPNDYTILTLPIVGPESLANVGNFVDASKRILRQGKRIFGRLSPDIYFARDGDLQLVATELGRRGFVFEADEVVLRAVRDSAVAG